MQTAFPSSSASMDGSVSETFSIVLYPTSYWRDKSAHFISPPNFVNSTLTLNICSLGLAVSTVYGGWC